MNDERCSIYSTFLGRGWGKGEAKPANMVAVGILENHGSVVMQPLSGAMLWPGIGPAADPPKEPKHRHARQVKENFVGWLMERMGGI